MNIDQHYIPFPNIYPYITFGDIEFLMCAIFNPICRQNDHKSGKGSNLSLTPLLYTNKI